MHQTETGLYYAIIAGLVMLLFFMAMFIRGIVRYQRKLVKIHTEKVKGQFHLLDKERQRIAADLHDELGSSIANIKLHLQRIKGLDGENKNLIQKCETFIENVMQKISSIAYNLMPIVLEKKGLTTALRELVDSVQKSTETVIYFECDADSLDPAKWVHVYRICQEIIHNILKHSGATLIAFRIHEFQKILKIRVADNGCGFDKNKMFETGKGLGLYNIEARVFHLNGTIQLTASPGNGVNYSIEIPV